MKEKIMNIKNILKIVIMIFIIFSAIKSCSKAYTYDEFRSFVSDIYDKNIGSSDLRAGMYKFLNSDTQIKNTFNSNNLNISNYNNWLLMANNQYSFNLYFYNGTVPDYTVQNDNLFSPITFPGSTAFKYQIIYYNNQFSYRNYSNYSSTSNLTMFLFEKNPINDDFKGAVAQNYLVKDITFTPNNQGTITEQGQVVNVIKNIYRYSTVNLGKVEEYIENERFNYVELLNGNNLVASMKYNNISKQLLQSNHMDIEVVDNVSPPYDLFRVDNWVLYLDTFYTLNIYSADTDTVSNTNYDKVSTFYYIFLRENAVISNGVITNYGSGEGFTTQNATNSIIDNSQTQNSFWQNAYNSLFVMSSGDVDSLIQKISGEMANFTQYTDLEEERQLLEDIRTTQPGDFVISWETAYYENQIIIPSGEINFTTMVEEYNLEQIHEYAQVIIAGFLTLLAFKGIWNCICITLGIGTILYDNLEQENAIVDSVEDYYDQDTGLAYQLNIRKYRNNTSIRRHDTTEIKPKRRIGY